MNESYLIMGLDALSRAHDERPFGKGHIGAAIISAYFFCRDNDVEDDVARIISDMIDSHWSRSPQCAPAPDERADPELLRQVIETLDRSIGTFRAIGHNAIFAASAIKAFRYKPETITPFRVAGVCRLIEAMSGELNYKSYEGLPSLHAPEVIADAVLSEFLWCVRAFAGRGHGRSGHLLTFGHALMELRLNGYPDLATKGESALRQFLWRIRLGPLSEIPAELGIDLVHEVDAPKSEPEPTTLLPHQTAYWTNLQTSWSPQLAHSLKYPCALYALLEQSTNVDLKKSCVSEAYRILYDHFGRS
jgi:hypothetical protein